MTREIGARLEMKGILFADAPVARTRDAAAKGELSIMVGASAGTFAHIRDILETMGTDVRDGTAETNAISEREPICMPVMNKRNAGHLWRNRTRGVKGVRV